MHLILFCFDYPCSSKMWKCWIRRIFFSQKEIKNEVGNFSSQKETKKICKNYNINSVLHKSQHYFLHDKQTTYLTGQRSTNEIIHSVNITLAFETVLSNLCRFKETIESPFQAKHLQLNISTTKNHQMTQQSTFPSYKNSRWGKFFEDYLLSLKIPPFSRKYDSSPWK